MFGVFIFKAKPEDKAYKYKKESKTPLKFTDEELVHFVKTTPKMSYFLHFTDKYEKVSDEDKILSTKQYWDDDYSSFKKMRGIENAYQTDDGKYFIKLIKKNKDWFSKYF